MARLVYGGFILKIVVIAQIVLSSWGYLDGGSLMPVPYGYTHSILVLFGALCIAKPKSTDIVIMYMAMNIFTIVNDIILLALYQPPTSGFYGHDDTYRFSLGMVIMHLILKPAVCFVLYNIYRVRGGEIPDELCTIRVSGSGSAYNGYDNIDSSVEVASPHQTIDNTPPQA